MNEWMNVKCYCQDVATLGMHKGNRKEVDKMTLNWGGDLRWEALLTPLAKQTGTVRKEEKKMMQTLGFLFKESTKKMGR